MRKFLVLLFSIFFLEFSLGQEVGFHMGVNISNQVQKQIPKNIPDYKSVSGIRVGIDLTKKISKNLNFMSGLSFVQKGANRDWDFSETGFIFKIRNTLNYFEVPLSILICNTDVKTTPIISFGAYAAFLVSGKSATPSRLDPTEIFKKNDYGIRISTGIKANRLWFGVSYDLGLDNINSTGGEFIIKNRSWGRLVSYFPKL